MDSIQYKCPNCGGELVFDPNTGAYSCPYCLSKFSQEDMDRVTAAKEAQAQQLQAQTAALSPKKPLTAEEEAARVYTCNSCGAEIMTDGTTAAGQQHV